MSKSVLIVDTPACCLDCNLFYRDDEDFWVCYPEWLQADKYPADDAWNFNPFKERMPECPLIPIEHFIQKTKEVLEETVDAHTAYCHHCNSYQEVSTSSENEYSDWFYDFDKEKKVTKWRYKKVYRTCKQCGKRILVDYGTERGSVCE